MKYYVYLSDSKIDMLYGQIAHSRDETREASLGFDVKVLKGELKTARNVPETKYTQLEAVVSKLRELDCVGNLWARKPYVYGQFQMVWTNTKYSHFPEGLPPITFWGYHDEFVSLGLAGSSYHIVGQRRAESLTHFSGSITDHIIDWLLYDVLDEAIPEESPRRMGPVGLNNQTLSRAIELTTLQIHGAAHRFEFLAKVLHRGEPDPALSCRHVIIATPLYVAQLD